MAYDEPKTDEEKLERFKKWLKLCQDAEANQRDREKEDIRFQVAENQWPADAKQERAGRPMLSISLIHQPKQLVYNQAANAKLGVRLSAVNETATDELAEIKQGLYQRIQRDGQADLARLWAFDRAIQCGRGWYRINTKWDEESDNPSDQEITYERILYQENVYPDPAANKPDFSDARYIFVAAYMPCDTFRQQYPKAQFNTQEDFGGLIESAPEWVRGDSKDLDPLVAECFYRVVEYEDVELPTRDGEIYRRQREVVHVRRAVLSGCEIIEDEPWIGRYIPLVPVIGRELQPIDGQRRWEGMVRPARDGQMAFNYAASSMVEDISRTSKAPYVGVEGQFEGYEDEWAQANRRNIPFLQYRAVSLDGKPAPPPQPVQIDGTKMNLSMQLMQEAKGLVQVSTAVYEPSLGEMQAGAKGQSGRAIQALQQQADAGTGNYSGNLATITLPYEAKVVLDLIPLVYDRPGRVTQVLGLEDEARMVMLNAPFMPGNDKRPQAVRPGPGGALPQGAKSYDLSQGKYSVAVSIGKSFQTRLQEGAEEMGALLQALPPEVQVLLLPTYMRFKDTPGAKETADILTKFRDMKFPGIANKEGEQPTPEQIQSENQALQQKLQQVEQQLQQVVMALETEQAKQQATLQKAELDAQAGAQKAQLDAQTKMALEQMEGENAAALEQIRQQFALQLEQLKAENALRLAEFEAAHETALAAAQAQTMKVTREDGREEGREDESNTSQGRSSQPEES